MSEQLSAMSGGELMQEVSKTQEELLSLCGEYEKGIGVLDKLQTIHIEASKKVNEAKNALKVTRSKIEQVKEKLKSCKILLKAEAAQQSE